MRITKLEISKIGMKLLRRDIGTLAETLMDLEDNPSDEELLDDLDYYLSHACMIWNSETN